MTALIVDVPFTYKIAGTRKGGRKRHRLTILETCPQEVAEVSLVETSNAGSADVVSGEGRRTASFRGWAGALWIAAGTDDIAVSARLLHLSESDDAIAFDAARLRDVVWEERGAGLAEAARIARRHLLVDGVLHRRTPGPRLHCRLAEAAKSVSIDAVLPEEVHLPARTTTPALAFAASTLCMPSRDGFLRDYAARTIKRKVDPAAPTVDVDPALLRDGGECVAVSARAAFGTLVSEVGADQMTLPYLEAWLAWHALPLSSRHDPGRAALLLEAACTDPSRRVALSGVLKSLLRSLDVLGPIPDPTPVPDEADPEGPRP